MKIAAKQKATMALSPERVVHPIRFEGDDEALVRALRAEHPGAYRVLYQRYAGEILRVLYRVLGSDDEMDELLHEVFVRAFRNVGAVESPDRLKAWLTGIAIFVARGPVAAGGPGTPRAGFRGREEDLQDDPESLQKHGGRSHGGLHHGTHRLRSRRELPGGGGLVPDLPDRAPRQGAPAGGHRENAIN